MNFEHKRPVTFWRWVIGGALWSARKYGFWSLFRRPRALR